MSVITDYQIKTDPQKALFYNIGQLAVIRICSGKIILVQQLSIMFYMATGQPTKIDGSHYQHSMQFGAVVSMQLY